MRLEPVLLSQNASIDSILSYFMGKNTPQRQKFIIENLRSEKDESEDGSTDELKKRQKLNPKEIALTFYVRRESRERAERRAAQSF